MRNEFGCPASTSGGGYIDPAFQNPRVSSFTGGIEQALPYNLQLTATYSYVHSTHLRTGGYDSEEAWQRNYIIGGTDPFGRSILQGATNYDCVVPGQTPCVQNTFSSFSPTPLDPTLPTSNNETASFSHGNYQSLVVNLTKRFSNHFQLFANYIWSQNQDNAASERDTDTYFGQQDPINLAIDYGRNGLDITQQFKAAGVYELPWGFEVSSSLIAHSGVPFPLYIAQDINGDEVSDLGHNNDRPTYTTAGGKTFLLGRYPFDQPSYFEWDARLQKTLRVHDRLNVVLSGDFFNLTNHGNVYSNPNNPSTATISLNGCTNNSPAPGPGFVGSVPGPLGIHLRAAHRRHHATHRAKWLPGDYRNRSRQHAVRVPSRRQVRILTNLGPLGRRQFLQSATSSMIAAAAGGESLRQASRLHRIT